MNTRKDFKEAYFLVQNVLAKRALGLDFEDKFMEFVTRIVQSIMDEEGETEPSTERIGEILSVNLSLNERAFSIFIELCDWLITEDSEFESSIILSDMEWAAAG